MGGAGRTFARGGATVVFEVGAVFAFVVFGAVAVVIGGQVEAVRSVLTRVGRAVIDIQLGGGGEGAGGGVGFAGWGRWGQKRERVIEGKAAKFDS